MSKYAVKMECFANGRFIISDPYPVHDNSITTSEGDIYIDVFDTIGDAWIFVSENKED